VKLSDYIAQYLLDIGIKHVFCLSGGASLHLIHSCNDLGLKCIVNQHEQASAMCADGYARASNNIGVAITTSGPGATNLITGIAGAYYDSIPCLFITGQTATFRLKKDTGVRQKGFQETDIVNICKEFTKYAVQITDPSNIKYELEKAIWIAKDGRPGPVLIDIPDDIQRKFIVPYSIRCYTPPPIQESNIEIDKCLSEIYKAKRPVIILGAGIKLSDAKIEARQLVDKLKFPFVPTWGAVDVIDNSSQYYCNTFGTHGTRVGNFTVQNADLIISIGSRLDTKATGYPVNTFARNAKKIMVDIDQTEINKFDNEKLIDIGVCTDAKNFISQLLSKINIQKINNIKNWIDQIKQWKNNYTIVDNNIYDSYNFFDDLSDLCCLNDNIVLDTGCTLAWALQAFRCKGSQILMHDWNNTAMGWALPAAIGAYVHNNQRTICVAGDGSMQMNIQELATINRNNLPIKIIVMNNYGHSMIKQTQEQWLDSEYIASSIEGGLPKIDFCSIGNAYGIPSQCHNLSKKMILDLKSFLESNGAGLFEILVNPDERVKTQVKFGRPLEDLEPLLSREEMSNNMIVDMI
jgi:acetolactate synthase-1/2/3 large subunit